MKRLWICCAAVAALGISLPELAAQTAGGSGSYQSILAQAGMASADEQGYGGFKPNNPTGTPTSYSPSFSSEGIQGPDTSQVIDGSLSPAAPMAGTADSSCSSCTAGSIGSFAPSTSLGGCDGGGYGYGGIGNGSLYSDGGVDGGGYGCISPVLAAPSRNYFGGLYGLAFDRDFEDDVFLTRNPAGAILRSTDADTGTLGGLETVFGTRTAAGIGWEARYWGLFADEATANLTGTSFQTYLVDLQNLIWPATGDTVLDVFDRGTDHTIRRDNELHNVELSMLRRGGSFNGFRGRGGSYEMLAGFRWFEFDEEFCWHVTGPVDPVFLSYNTEVGNTLLGFQLGGRTETYWTQRLRFFTTNKVGVYNNRARATQVISNTAGAYATVNGTDFNFTDDKNDVSFLGELDLGTAYHLSPCSRLVTGYRLIGVSGIALAPNQYNNFNFEPAIRDIQTNGDLILHGAFFGFEFCR